MQSDTAVYRNIVLKHVVTQYQINTNNCTHIFFNHHPNKHYTPLQRISTLVGQQNSTLKLYIDQRNAQVYNLFIYLLLSYMFRAFF
jgi:hypothetical protein